jgi:hypothetical protein
MIFVTEAGGMAESADISQSTCPVEDSMRMALLQASSTAGMLTLSDISAAVGVTEKAETANMPAVRQIVNSMATTRPMEYFMVYLPSFCWLILCGRVDKYAEGNLFLGFFAKTYCNSVQNSL